MLEDAFLNQDYIDEVLQCAKVANVIYVRIDNGSALTTYSLLIVKGVLFHIPSNYHDL